MIDLVIRRWPGHHWVWICIGRGIEPGRGEGAIYRLGICWRRAWAVRGWGVAIAGLPRAGWRKASVGDGSR